MNIFKGIERKLEGVVEGGFGRAFKASVQPVELAHKLAKEMGDHKTVGVANVYVPNEFEIYLGSEDYAHLSSFADSLKTELSSYVVAYAQREGWTLVSPPRIELRQDDDLHLGEFGIGTRTVNEPPSAAPPAGSRRRGGPRGCSWAAAGPDRALPSATGARHAGGGAAQRPSRGAARCAGASGSCATWSPSSDAAGAATSSSTIPTSRVSTPRSGVRKTATSCAISVPPTACV